MPQVLAFAIELYEAGILTDKDLDFSIWLKRLFGEKGLEML
jgi:hypothetical protein